MIFGVLAGLTGLMVVLTLLPLSRKEAWWVRAAEFPRLQLAAIALLLLVVEAIFLDLSRPACWLLMAATLACLVYQLWWIVPYTALYPKEVLSSDRRAVEDTLRLMNANVLTPNRNAEALLAMVHEERPDILVAVETDLWWQSRLDALEPEYPHVIKCPLDNLYGMHVYSRLPLEDGAIQFLVEPDVPSIHAAVVLPSGRRLRLHCVHPKPPSPTENPESSERDAELVAVGRAAADSELPVIVMGDLNDVAWSATTRLFRKVSGLLDPRVGRGMYNTFHAKYPPLRWPLDHVFHSDDLTLVQLRRLADFGSDHFPILVELALAPRRSDEQEGLTADGDDHAQATEKARSEGAGKEDVHTPG